MSLKAELTGAEDNKFENASKKWPYQTAAAPPQLYLRIAWGYISSN